MRYGDRPAFCLLVACVVGLLLSSLGYWLPVSLALAGITGISFLLRRSGRLRLDPFLLLLPLVSVGYGWYAQTVTQPGRSLPPAMTLYDAELRVRHPVASSLESAIRYDAEVTLPEGGSIRLLVTLPEPESGEAIYGRVLRGDIDLVSLEGDRRRSYTRYLLSEGYIAQGYGHRMVDTGRKCHTLRSRLMEWRAGLVDRFERATAGRLGTADRGLIYALCLGDRLHLPGTVKEDFTASGVAHVLAVSGYHLGIVFALMGGLLGLLLPGYRWRRLRSLLLFVGLGLYTLLTGASTATVRAFVMSSIYLLAGVLGRRADPVQVLSLTLLFFLFVTPYSLYSVGLMLSVSAVWGLMTFMPLLTTLVSPSRRWLRYAWETLAACLSAQIGVLPLLFLYFGRAAGSMLWSALPVAIASGLLIPVGLVALLWTGLFGTLPPLFIRGLALLGGGMRSVTEHFADPVFSLSVTMEVDIVLVLLYYAIVQTIYRLAVRLMERWSV